MNNNGTFFDMPIGDGMKNTLKLIGFDQPTPIQAQAIPHLLLGHDLLGQAQTGTGKTAAFAIPLIEMVNPTDRKAQALVMCPTRELCLQVSMEIKRLAAHNPDIDAVALYGGQGIEHQLRTLKKESPSIVVATPGRLFDHLRRKSIDLSSVKMIVLDEADEMLDMGFRPEIEEVFSLLPEENQRIFFSATMPKAIKDLACAYLTDPKVIRMESKVLTNSSIEQNYFRIRARDKTELLCRMLDLRSPKLSVVFLNAKSSADELANELGNCGFDVGVLHGDLNQNQRDRVMGRFRKGTIKVLVATDVAARGLDIDDIEMVINYHLPHDPEDYVHRIGRTGRAGRKGYAISLVEPRDNTRLRRISQFARVDIAEKSPPSVDEIRHAKIKRLFLSVKDGLSSPRAQEYRDALVKQKLSAEDVAVGMMHSFLERFETRLQNSDAIQEAHETEDRGYWQDRPRERVRRRGDRSRPSRRPANDRRSFSAKDRDDPRGSKKVSERHAEERNSKPSNSRPKNRGKVSSPAPEKPRSSGYPKRRLGKKK